MGLEVTEGRVRGLQLLLAALGTVSIPAVGSSQVKQACEEGRDGL